MFDAVTNYLPPFLGKQYIFLTQIWFGECNEWLLKVKNFKVRVVCVGNFEPLMHIDWIFHTKSKSD